MDRRAWEEASERRCLAAEHLRQVEKAARGDLAAIARPWEAFITELTRAFNKLFHGERRGTEAEAIIKRIRRDRKDDPLLSFLRQARDSLEHGIGQVVTHSGKARPLQAHEDVPNVGFVICSEDGSEQEITFERENTLVIENLQPVLVPINIGGRTVDPPTQHFGADITGITPVDAGRLALEYLDERLGELQGMLET